MGVSLFSRSKPKENVNTCIIQDISVLQEVNAKDPTNKKTIMYCSSERLITCAPISQKPRFRFDKKKSANPYISILGII